MLMSRGARRNVALPFAVGGGMLSRASGAVDKTPADDLDELAGLALAYRDRSARFINARLPAGQGPPKPGDVPGAAETVLWLSSRIYFMTTRALVGKALAAGGGRERGEDASISAGLRPRDRARVPGRGASQR